MPVPITEANQLGPSRAKTSPGRSRSSSRPWRRGTGRAGAGRTGNHLTHVPSITSRHQPRITASTRHHPMLPVIPALLLAGSKARGPGGDCVQVPGQPGEAPPGAPYRQQRAVQVEADDRHRAERPCTRTACSKNRRVPCRRPDVEPLSVRAAKRTGTAERLTPRPRPELVRVDHEYRRRRGASLPFRVPRLHMFATAVWALAGTGGAWRDSSGGLAGDRWPGRTDSPVQGRPRAITGQTGVPVA